jgi:hypothetical protein
MKIANTLLIVFCLLFSSISVFAQKPAEKTAFKVDFEKFTLPNGLEVIFHVDRSDPVVAVNLTAHVGSAREKAGRTGFAPERPSKIHQCQTDSSNERDMAAARATRAPCASGRVLKRRPA